MDSIASLLYFNSIFLFLSHYSASIELTIRLGKHRPLSRLTHPLPHCPTSFLSNQSLPPPLAFSLQHRLYSPLLLAQLSTNSPTTSIAKPIWRSNNSNHSIGIAISTTLFQLLKHLIPNTKKQNQHN